LSIELYLQPAGCRLAENPSRFQKPSKPKGAENQVSLARSIEEIAKAEAGEGANRISRHCRVVHESILSPSGNKKICSAVDAAAFALFA